MTRRQAGTTLEMRQTGRGDPARARADRRESHGSTGHGASTVWTVPVPDGAPLYDRLAGFFGRDPG
jgi:hypothetical protein